MSEQHSLPYGPIRNSGLFSNHWLENRLPLEPEWTEIREEARTVLDHLAAIWQGQHDRVEHYGDEQGLEYAFIQPVFEALGWKLKYQTFLRGRKPDYALFLDDGALAAAIKAGRSSPDFWKYPVLLADSKAWDIGLDRRTGGGKAREFPPEQIEWYLNQSELPFAILTNGRLWRLIPRHHDADQPRFQTYLECNLPSLVELWTGIRGKGEAGLEQMWRLLDVFVRFYLFFSPKGFLSIQARPPLVERALKGSSEYRLGVGEGLKERVFEALRICIEGFLSHPANGLSDQRDLPVCRSNSFTLLYRLLFIMYAEDRGLLPYRLNKIYTDNRSLGRHRDEIATGLDKIKLGQQDDYDARSTGIWQDLGNLFDLIDRGHARYGVPAYNGGLFDPETHPFLASKAIPDRYLARVIDQLGRAPDPQPLVGLARVDYRDLAIQHLGGIYEGLLELHPHCSQAPVVVIRREGRNGWEERTQPADAEVPKGFEVVKRYAAGQVYLLNNKGERRASGSYYTPNHIVDYIVEKTLGPLCRRIDEQLQEEIAQAEEAIKGKRNSTRAALEEKLAKLASDFDDRVLSLHILDPAMGSGHFLLRVCQYLAEEIATNPHAGDPAAGEVREDQSTLTYWKRRIVEHCIYGVDLNPVAVELAKLALWLETAAIDRPLTFLDHHLRCGNSLVGAELQVMGALPGEKVPGTLLAAQVTARLPIMLKALADIAAMPSENVQQVKEKEKLYAKVFDPARAPLALAADVWCSKPFLPPDRAVKPNQYQDLLNALDQPKTLKAIAAEPWAVASLSAARDESINCFHWQLEFPEVFFDARGLREGGGFDAIVGNPPYDVLSDKETGHDLSALKSFLASQAVYAPSFRGKNNLYKLFVCKGVNVLAEGGHLGLITPMALLGDAQAAEIRRLMLANGTFTAIDAFPQEDDPDTRVFPEAKMCTTVITYVKSTNKTLGDSTFITTRHPSSRIVGTSPKLTMSRADVASYDPINWTIPACDQADWDIATQITNSGRMGRIKDVVEFFQGEVNETIDRSRGNLTSPTQGSRIVRGACVCLYVTRAASQGKDIYLDIEKFLDGKGNDTKAFHHRYRRVVVQRVASRSNVKRVIAATLAAGSFCNDLNYCPEHLARIPIEVIVAVLNSRLLSFA